MSEDKTQVKSNDAEPAEADEVMTKQEATASTVQSQKKGNKTGLYLLLGCLGLLIICCCTICGLLMFAPSAIGGAVASTTEGRDEDLTRISEDDITQLEDSVEEKESERDARVSQVGEDTYQVTFTEEEVLYIIADSIGVKDPSAIGIDIEDNYMKLEVGFSELLESSAAEGEQVENAEFFNDLYFSAEMSNSADNSRIVVDDISTGNGFFDSFLPEDLLTEFENSLNEGFQDTSSGVTLEAIEFQQDAIVFTYSASPGMGL
jgi:hypothetical protein